jgi:type I restriction enzyme, S subunit
MDSGSPIILYGRLYTKYEIAITDVDTFVVQKSGSIITKGGEVIVPASGETAEDIAIASVVERPGLILGGDLNVIYPNERIDPIFLALSITYGKPHIDMVKRAQGKSVVHLHNSDLRKVMLDFPKREEQLKISQYFKSLDSLITLHQRKVKMINSVLKAIS